MRKLMHAILCHFGFCSLRKDPYPINGVWWAFCRHCGGRYGGEYDMATGETHWKPR